MTYAVSDASMLQGLASGQAVDFRIKEEEGRYLVTEIEQRVGQMGADKSRAAGDECFHVDRLTLT